MGATWNRSGGIGKSHEGSGVVGSNVDVVGEESAVHSGHKSGAQGHKSHGGRTVTAGKAHANETGSRKQRSYGENKKILDHLHWCDGF